MKKLFYAVMAAVVAVTLSSCFGKTATPGQSDPQEEAPNEAGQLNAAMESQLNAGNGEGFFALVSNIQEKALGFIKDNPEKAKEYLGTAQKFLKDNSAKIGEVLGKITNSELAERAQDLIKSVSEQPVDQLLGLVGAASEQLEGAQEAVEGVAGDVQEAVEGAVEGAKDKVQGAVQGAVEGAKDKVQGAVQGASDKVQGTVDAAAGALQQAIPGM
jgi:uncharacterized protein YjbJ (UPF0337 family)